MKYRKCLCCGENISDRPKHHYLCYGCWCQQIHGDYSKNEYYDYNDYEFTNKDKRKNDTYEDRYKGDPEYDMGPDWDYDEFPPENL